MGAPYISLQVYHHTSVELPAVRPLSLYTLPATYTALRSSDVLVNKRPGVSAGWFWDLPQILGAFARENGHTWHFVDHRLLGNSSWESWASFRAAIYYPYEW